MKLLSVNEYTRPGRALQEIDGIILHGTGDQRRTAKQIYNYFEYDCPKLKHYSSAHYVIDLDGTIVQLIPDIEVAYHCGTSQKDPETGLAYTKWARKKFGKYASNPMLSPNQVTIGIEMCANDTDGSLTRETIISTMVLVVELSKKYCVPFMNIGTHEMVVGWKPCPLYWNKNPFMKDSFFNDLSKRIL